MDKKQIDLLIKTHSARILGYLIRRMGSFDDAEDVHQEVMLVAIQDWRTGIPAEPLPWLFTVAKNKATDYFRQGNRKLKLLKQLEDEPHSSQSLDRYLEDDLLRLIFTCCHPAIDPEVRVALTLKTVVGLTMEEVSRAYLLSVGAMEQRLVRVKRKIKLAGIAYEIPETKQLRTRIQSVLQTIYLLFNEGYTATSGESLIRESLCKEAITLGRLMNNQFPDQAAIEGVLALMLLQDSRRAARISGEGSLILLAEQDRALWDKKQIEEGLLILDHALALQQKPEEYLIQAAIAALHVQENSNTDWSEIVLLYQQLKKHNQSPVVELNYAVALSMNGEQLEALACLKNVEDSLKDYHPFYIARAEMKIKMDKADAGINDLKSALYMTKNLNERKYLQQRIATLQDER